MMCAYLLAVFCTILSISSASDSAALCESASIPWLHQCDWSQGNGMVGLMQTQVLKSARLRSQEAGKSPVPSKVVFIKTHATGSSTMGALLFRHCELHQKRCAPFPEGIAGSSTVERITLAGYARAHVGKIDIWPYHVMFETDLLEELMPGALKVSVFREPISRVISSYAHYRDASSITDAVELLMGETGETPNCGAAGQLMTRQIPITKFHELDFVMMTEFFDLSLVLLGRRLGWELHDLLYVRLKSHTEMEPEIGTAMSQLRDIMNQPRETMTASTRAFMDKCTGGKEAQLYQMAKQAFSKQWQSLTPSEQASIERDVARFEAGLGALDACCESSPADQFCKLVRMDCDVWRDRLQSGETTPASTWSSPCRQDAMDAMAVPPIALVDVGKRMNELVATQT